MTVGLAAACKDGDSQKVVVAADKMMTLQRASPIEFEHPGTKIKEIEHPEVNAVAVASGSSSISDKFFDRFNKWIDEDVETSENETIQDIDTVEELSQIASQVHNHILRETINSRSLEQYGLKLGDIQKSNQIDEQLLRSLMQDINEIREQFINSLSVLFVGVDSEGAKIYQINGGDYHSLNSLGYAAIGSGMQPAQSEFIYNRYNKNCKLEEALRSVTAAKMKAEEAQGVGEKTDMYIVSKNDTKEVEEDTIDDLRDVQKKIMEKQTNARQQVINNNELDI